MDRVLGVIREGFLGVGKNPWLAAPAGALVLCGFALARLPLPLLPQLLATAATAGAATAYAWLREPYLEGRLAGVFVMFYAPWQALQLLSIPAADLASRGMTGSAAPHLWSNGYAAYGHLTVMATGLVAAAAGAAIRPLAEGDGALSSWRQGWAHVLSRFSVFAVLSAVYWIAEHFVGGSFWPLGAFMSALLLHVAMIEGGMRL